MANGFGTGLGAAVDVAGNLSEISNRRRLVGVAEQNAATAEQNAGTNAGVLSERIQQNRIDLTNAAYDDLLTKYDRVGAELRSQLGALPEDRNEGRIAQLREMATALNQTYNQLGSAIGKAPIALNPEFSMEAQTAGEEAGAEAAARQAVEPFERQSIQTRDLEGNEVDVSFVFDKKTGQIVGQPQILGRGPTREFSTVQTLTGGQEQQLQLNVEQLSQIAGAVKSVRNAPDADKGFVGSARRVISGAGSLAGDVLEVFGAEIGETLRSAAQSIQETARLDVGNIDDAEFANELLSPNLAQVPTVEALMAYAVARTLRPDGRLDKETIKVARERAQITGLTSAQASNDRLDELLGIIEGQIGALEKSRPGVPRTKAESGEPARFKFNPETGQLDRVE